MTTYSALSPRRRTECGHNWELARDTLVDDAMFLGSPRSKGPGTTNADKEAFIEAATAISGWQTPGVPLHLTFFDGWGSPRRFQIIAQEELAL